MNFLASKFLLTNVYAFNTLFTHLTYQTYVIIFETHIFSKVRHF